MTLLPTATARQTRHAVGDLLRPRRLLALAAVLTLVAGTVAGLVVPRVIGHLVDLVLSGHGAGAVTWPVVLVAGLGLLQALFEGVGQALVARLGERSLAELREQVVERALAVPARTVEEGGTGDLVSRVSTDVADVAEAVRSALPQLVTAALTIGLTLVGLLALDWRLALAALVAAPVQAGAARWYLRRSTPIYARQRIAAGRRTQQLLESVDGAATVRAFGLSETHLAAVTARSQEAVDIDLEANRTATRFFGRLNLAEYLGLTAILVVGFLLVRADAATVGAIAAAALYFHRLFDPINGLLGLLGTAQEATAGLARLVGVTLLESPAEQLDDRASGGPPTIGTDIDVDAVSFAYDDRDVLHDVSLTVRPGALVALVGASGAGKTTLAAIVAGTHLPRTGSVTIGGRTVGSLGPVALRRTVVQVTQEVHVFAGPLADDLRLAAPEATDADLRAALAAVGADWAGALPNGLDTVVGEGGHRLTAGQAQQLAFARLLLVDPPVAVLDEATADAGSAGARVLDRVAATVLEGRTALVVAHRLTQAAAADLVVVLDHGRVAEVGSHDDLVAGGGAYARLWKAWSALR